jgi:RNA polymerase sigma factor (TIGR02999 family)
MTDINGLELIDTAEAGNTGAHDQLFETFYGELRRMAARELRRNAAATLTPTTLLHETFLSFSRRESAAFEDRARFMTYSAHAMRGLIVDHLRNRKAQKRGGAFQFTSLPTELQHAAADDVQLEKLNEALDGLARIDARLAECVELKFFCGFTFGDIARMWEVSERTVQRDWDKARLLLNRLMTSPEPTLGAAI